MSMSWLVMGDDVMLGGAWTSENDGAVRVVPRGL